MHSKYIKENGIDSYNSLMGIEDDQLGTKIDDHSSTINLGLLNIKSKTESYTKYEYNGLTFKEYIEIGLAIVIVLGAARALYRYLKKRKTRTSNKKKNQLKEIEVEARIQTTTMSPNQSQKMENQLVPVNIERKNQLVPVNKSRLPLFSSALDN